MYPQPTTLDREYAAIANMSTKPRKNLFAYKQIFLEQPPQFALIGRVLALLMGNKIYWMNKYKKNWSSRLYVKK